MQSDHGLRLAQVTDIVLENKESDQISLLTNSSILMTRRILLFVCAEINEANGMREQKIDHSFADLTFSGILLNLMCKF